MAEDLFSSLESARLPVRYMASLLSAGNEAPVVEAYKVQMAVRLFKRAEVLGDVASPEARKALEEAHITAGQAEDIYRLTARADFGERYVIPPLGRELALETQGDLSRHVGEEGTGFLHKPIRGF